MPDERGSVARPIRIATVVRYRYATFHGPALPDRRPAAAQMARTPDTRKAAKRGSSDGVDARDSLLTLTHRPRTPPLISRRLGLDRTSGRSKLCNDQDNFGTAGCQPRRQTYSSAHRDRGTPLCPADLSRGGLLGSSPLAPNRFLSRRLGHLQSGPASSHATRDRGESRHGHRCLVLFLRGSLSARKFGPAAQVPVREAFRHM
jgi:hypothetical protein